MAKRSVLIMAIALAVGVGLAVAFSRLDSPTPAPARAEYPQRIICMAPNIAEAIFAFGGGDRVAGVSQYTTYPPEAAARPTVGALYNPDLEAIVALEPDLVIVQQQHEKVEALCRARGIPLMRVEMIRVDGILAGIRELGERLGMAQQAQALAASVEADLEAVREHVRGLPRKRVFLCLDRAPDALKGLFTAGGTSFLTELLEVAGGENIFADARGDFPQVALETLLMRAPEVIIETHPSQGLSEERLAALRRDWNALPGLPAVRDGRIHMVTDDYIVVPGPRIGLIARRFAKLLHETPAQGSK